MYLKGMDFHDESKKQQDANKNSNSTAKDDNAKNKLTTNKNNKNDELNNNIYAKKIDSIIYGKNQTTEFSLKKYITNKISKLFNIGNARMNEKKISSRKNSIAQYDTDLDKFLTEEQSANEYRDITDIYDNKINQPIDTDYELINIHPANKNKDCFSEKLKKTINTNSTDKLTTRKGNISIISINLVIDDAKKISGKQLLPQILAAGLMYGDMSIFHRYYNNDGTGKILFSLANGMEPGAFNLEEFENSQVSALTFFMTIPGPDTLMQAFANMINTATIFAEHFNVEMKDKDFCTITNQTIEHYRQCIRDFQRKQLLVKPSL